MLDWIFKYKVRVPGAAQKPAATVPADQPAAEPAKGRGAAPAKAAPAARKPAPEQPFVDWAARLQAARGDDAALLALARVAQSPLQTKLDAVAALAGEDTLKEAERAFRDKDRRVHSLAKQRAQALRQQRETRAQAAKLINAAQALADTPLIPVNSAVELDRAWSALDHSLLEPSQRDAYAALTSQLSTLTRQRAEGEAALKRWQADAKEALAQLQTACTQAASGEQPRSQLAQAREHAQTVAAAAPAGTDAAALHGAAAAAQALDARLELLERMLQGHGTATAPEATNGAAPDEAPSAAAPAAVSAASFGAAEAPGDLQGEARDDMPGDVPNEAATAEVLTEVQTKAPAEAPADPPSTPPAEAATEAATDAAADANANAAGNAVPAAARPPRPPAPRSPAQQWKEAPPLADSRLAGLLQARFEAWQRTQEDARQQQKAQRRELVQGQKQAVRSERAGALEAVLAQAEARLAEGLVAETHKHLIEIDELLHAGAPADALRARIGRLQDGYAELRGWQHWAGGRARDDLTAEAEALAASCAPGPEGQAPKLQLKAHGEQIDSLWARWKELDRLGGASSRALWQRFDAALKTAYEPLAAVKAAQSAAREQNLAARRQLLDVLESVPLPGEGMGDGTGEGAGYGAGYGAVDGAVDGAGDGAGADQGAATGSGTGETARASTAGRQAAAPANLRQAVLALDQFRVEWRKLGPLEHTVPRKAQDRLVQRMDAAVQRLHGPVDAARQVAQQERQALIARAQALASAAQAQMQLQNNAPAGAGPGPRGAMGGGGPGGSGSGGGGYGGGPNGGGRDLVGEVRNLQAQWQQCAQGLPLPRQLENALWTQFRTALDAVFSAREAAFSARDAEFKAHADERVALIDKLEALVAALDTTPAADTKRALADVDTQWQRCGPAPRAQAAALDSRFRRAREAAQQWLSTSRQRSWQATCDALAAKLALCVARETGTASSTSGTGPGAANAPAHTAPEAATDAGAGVGADAPAATAADPLAQDWAALPALPAAWEAALQQRAGLATASPTAAPASTKKPAALSPEAVLLQLEVAWNLPSPPESASARRELQVQAMKAALESKRAAAAAALTPDQWLTEALRQPLASAALQARLHAVLLALRQRGPASP